MNEFKVPRPARVNILQLSQAIGDRLAALGYQGLRETEDELIFFTDEPLKPGDKTALAADVEAHDPDTLTDQQRLAQRAEEARERLLALDPRVIRDAVQNATTLAQMRPIIMQILLVLHGVIVALELNETDLDNTP